MAISAASSTLLMWLDVRVLESNFAMISEWWSESDLEPQSQWSLARYCGPYTPDCLELFGSSAWWTF